MVPVQNPGGHPKNKINIKIKAICTNKLSSILNAERKPINRDFSYTIILSFLAKNLMINSAKRFLKINKNVASKIFFV